MIRCWEVAYAPSIYHISDESFPENPNTFTLVYTLRTFIELKSLLFNRLSADAADLKSADLHRSWGFKSPSGHQIIY